MSKTQDVQKYPLRIPENIKSFEQPLLFIAHPVESYQLIAEISLVLSENKKIPLLTYNDNAYFLKLKPSQHTIEDLKNAYLEAKISHDCIVSLSFHDIELSENGILDIDDFRFYGDYIEKRDTSCYQTNKFQGKSGTLNILTPSPNLKIRINPDFLPKNPSEFQFLYSNTEFMMSPSAETNPVIRIPIHKSRTSQNKPMFICIESLEENIPVFIEIDKYDPLALEPNQNMKLYIRNDEKQLLLYSAIENTQKPMKLHISAEKGCANVLLKSRQSYFYGFLLNYHVIRGESPFEKIQEYELNQGDTSIFRVIAGQKEIVKNIFTPKGDTKCSGKNAFNECPTFLFVENCNKNETKEISVVNIRMEHENIENILGLDQTLFHLTKGKKLEYIIPHVTPRTSKLQIHLKNREFVTSRKLGIISVQNLDNNYQISQEIMGDKNETSIEFNSEKIKDIAGNYKITIEASSELSAKIWMTSYSQVNNEEVQIFNSRLPSSSNFVYVNPINSTHQRGYFTIKISDDSETETVIYAKPTGSLKNIRLLLNSENFVTDDKKAEFIGQTIRIPKNLHKNKYFYITAEAESSPEETSNGSISGIFSFIIYENTRNDELVIGKKYMFFGNRIFKIKLNGNKKFMLKKYSQTIEKLYISDNSENLLPFEDKYSKIINPISLDETEEYKEYNMEFQISNTKISEIYMSVFCIWPRCMYEFTLESLESSNEIPKNKNNIKIDL